MNKLKYEAQLSELQVELVYLQEWVQATGQRIVIVFEGRDTAGKGGMIHAITERCSSRVFRVEALPSPSDRERTQLYGQRYIERFPSAGEIVIFDRSWYNRAGVERVMGFCTEQQLETFMHNAPLMEKMIVREGIILLKYWLDIDLKEQRKRLQSRIDAPIKQWKLSPMDLESHKHWDDYTIARDDMLKRTSTEHAPWFVVNTNNKRKGRLKCIRHILDQIPYTKPEIDPVTLPQAKDRKSDVSSLKPYMI
ncbi:MAG: polyphosphate kinase 2 [Candidatus Pelagadaptatus aseana]|uniref:polyphosphate kinase 2 n=1 Tax=Candidatus Pelagadaptatus aseana TaxID=3120508 RepID=UPI0039B354A7